MSERSESDSDLRRRAAWLLGMLALVAVLFVVLLTKLLDSGGGSSSGAGPDDTLVTSTGAPVVTPSGPSGSTGSSPPGTPGSSGPASSSTAATRDCPTQDVCALEGDYGQAIAAINDYRRHNGQQAVPGRVSKAAQQCAKNNGSGCSGGWAESQVPSLDGDAAVQKVQRLGKLLAPMKSFSVGWAYDPRSKQYFFAVIRES